MTPGLARLVVLGRACPVISLLPHRTRFKSWLARKVEVRLEMAVAEAVVRM